MALPSLARVPAPPDPILGLAEAARADTRRGKINLSSGVFVDETGTTPVLPSVIEAERRILAAGRSKLYRPIDGEAAFRDAVRDLVFTPGHEVVRSGRVAVSQTPGGTGGLRVAADFIRQTGGGGARLDLGALALGDENLKRPFPVAALLHLPHGVSLLLSGARKRSRRAEGE